MPRLPGMHFEVKVGADGRCYYVTVGANGEICNTSQMYAGDTGASRASAKRGVEDVVRGLTGSLDGWKWSAQVGDWLRFSRRSSK